MSLFLVRMFDKGIDYPMVEEWSHGHQKNAPALSVLPNLGVVVRETKAETFEDVAALWLYMDNSGSGVCFAEYAITKPGIGYRRARLALLQAVDFLKLEAARLGYGLMIVHTIPAIARHLTAAGFSITNRELISLAAPTA